MYANAWAAGLFGYGSHTLLGEPLCRRWSLPQTCHGCAASCVPASRTWDRATAAWWPCSAATTAASMPAWATCATVAATCKLLIVRDLSDSERIRSALETSNRELQAMAGRLFSLQEDERRAISRDLHDDIGQAITAIKLSAHAALEEDDPQRRGQDLAQIVSLADTTVAKLRDISTLLRPRSWMHWAWRQRSAGRRGFCSARRWSCWPRSSRCRIAPTTASNRPASGSHRKA